MDISAPAGSSILERESWPYPNSKAGAVGTWVTMVPTTATEIALSRYAFAA